MMKTAFVFFFLCSASYAAPSSEQPGSRVPEKAGTYYSDCLSSKEMELLKLINEYRINNGLAPVPVSRSLSTVARTHAVDLHINKPYEHRDYDGSICTLHSWSDKGKWSPGCYTDDNRHARLMWNKPKEITDNAYTGTGYENVYLTLMKELSVIRAFESWENSPSHNSIILELGDWENIGWPAIGVGIYENVAVIWFGDKADPLGAVDPCGGRQDEEKP
ncbi:MAG: CAP domain-containing protein [Nitrospirae bacterium]|nr:CAP domain-containing protein [Nitrospirota bacterium]